MKINRRRYRSSGQVNCQMERNELYEAIFKRRSVREYTPDPLESETMVRVDAFMPSLIPAFPGIQTELRFLDNAEVQGMFKVDATHVLAVFSEVKEGYLANAGFLLQQMDLFFSANGIGSCWQGGPKLVRKAKSTSPLEYVISLSVGKPSGNPHRKDRSEFKRKELAAITNVVGQDGLLEAVRLAPSAANSQPWYFTGGDGIIQVHKVKSLVLDRVNSISNGIAMCHLWLAVRHRGGSPSIFLEDSAGRISPRRYAYVASMAID